MTRHWTEAYIGRPYVDGGCWLLFREVQAGQFGRSVDVPSIPDTPLRIMRAFESGSKSHRWVQVADRRDGDGILMSENEAPHHVGTYVAMPGGGRVLHSLKGQGSALHTFEHLKLVRFNIVGFYRPLEAQS